MSVIFFSLERRKVVRSDSSVEVRVIGVERLVAARIAARHLQPAHRECRGVAIDSARPEVVGRIRR